MSKSKLGPCKQQACDIQACLSSNDYQDSKCMKEIAALIKCCDERPAGESPVHCAFSSRYRKLVAEANKSSNDS